MLDTVGIGMTLYNSIDICIGVGADVGITIGQHGVGLKVKVDITVYS